ncbi:MAG: succinate dehydrogenase, hydrophobic membrane anchor protein [Rickettsiella sp.]|nr:succinate dehydrogenase, hydrophobic membrane anchor protein [Rickettsiella sp.]
MVKKLTNVTSLTGNGLRDWLIQRVTSLVMLVYIVFLLTFFVTHLVDYTVWQRLFSKFSMRVGSSLFLLSLIWHAWVGMWTIITDYIKPFVLRLTIQLLIIIGLLLCFVWGLAIFWGN